MSRQSTSLPLPPFFGVTRRLVLTVIGFFIAGLVLRVLSPNTEAMLTEYARLMPGRVFGLELWQPFTYPFLNAGLLSVIFGCISLWYIGSMVEAERGGRWLVEYFLVSTAGGALLACLISRAFLANSPSFGLDQQTSGIWPAVMALLLAYARWYPDSEARLYFVIRLKMKFVAAIFLAIDLATSLTGGDRFGALTTLMVCLSGYLFLLLAPRRGLRFAASEQMYGLRNAWYRYKRKQAARKFKVYMRKQGKEVSLDESGQYVPLDEERRNGSDRRWMN